MKGKKMTSKLETAIELIKAAQKIEKERENFKWKNSYGTPNEGSMTRHDEYLRIARRILLEHYYER